MGIAIKNLFRVAKFSEIFTFNLTDEFQKLNFLYNSSFTLLCSERNYVIWASRIYIRIKNPEIIVPEKSVNLGTLTECFVFSQ